MNLIYDQNKNIFRNISMNFIFAMIKKEILEILYAKKSIVLCIGTFFLMIYLSNTTYVLINNTDNSCYLLTTLVSIAIALQFISESILSDKRSQIFEIMIVSNKLSYLFFAKMITIVILCLIPYSLLFCYFLFNGINILYDFSLYLNTLLFFWIGGCSASIIVVFFNDERSAAIFGVISLLFIVVLIRAMFFLMEEYTALAGVLFLFLLAILITIIAKLLFKNTKIYLKNL